LTKARADKAELEAGEMSGELVRRSKVLDDLVRKLSNLRTRLLTIPPMLAPRIAPKDRAAEVQAEIQAAIDEALTELAGE
jgi:phage terminase Nu1 subunit (DNA packaging protein)